MFDIFNSVSALSNLREEIFTEYYFANFNPGRKIKFCKTRQNSMCVSYL